MVGIHIRALYTGGMISLSSLAGLALPVLLFLTPFPAPAGTRGVDHVEAEKLLQQAEELTDIRSSGSHSFRMAARLTISQDNGQAESGTYELLWESPTSWRDEIKLPDFWQVRIANVDRIFISRLPPYLPLKVFQSYRLLEFPDLLRIDEEKVAVKLHVKSKGGLPERSLEIAVAGISKKTVYLDASLPTPTRIEYKGSHSGYRFEDYRPFARHRFPYTLVEFSSNKPLFQLQVQELTEVTLNPSSFVVPSNAHWLDWCPHPLRARDTADSQKLYPIPWPLRNGALAQTAVIYGIIGTDGRWHNLAVVKSAGKEADSYWMDILRHQQFLPARCGDRVIEQESAMDFHFP